MKTKIDCGLQNLLEYLKSSTDKHLVFVMKSWRWKFSEVPSGICSMVFESGYKICWSWRDTEKADEHPPLHLPSHLQSNSLPKPCWVYIHILKHCCVDTLFCVWFDFYRLLWSNSINHKCWENTLKLLCTNTPWKWIEKFTRNAIYTRILNCMTNSAIQRTKSLGGESAASDHKA